MVYLYAKNERVGGVPLAGMSLVRHVRFALYHSVQKSTQRLFLFWCAVRQRQRMERRKCTEWWFDRQLDDIGLSREQFVQLNKKPFISLL